MERRQFILSGAAISFGTTTPVTANGMPEALTGDRFLAGRSEFRLVDIIAPALGAPFGEDAKKTLQQLLSGQTSVDLERHFTDRWGRKVGYLLLDGVSCQEKLVRAGVARVNPESDNYSKIAALLKIERSARRAMRGLWALGDYKVHDAYFGSIPIGGYGLVAGRVIEARARGTRFYLNFGDDWRTDFTVTARKKSLNSWKIEETQWEGLNAQNFLVRGYIEKINGPSIDLRHPMQLDFFDDEKTMPLFSSGPEMPQVLQERFLDRDL